MEDSFISVFQKPQVSGRFGYQVRHLSSITGAYKYHIYHFIENTANHNATKPLYIRQYSLVPSNSNQAGFATLTSIHAMMWDRLVIQFIRVVVYTMEYPTCHL